MSEKAEGATVRVGVLLCARARREKFDRITSQLTPQLRRSVHDCSCVRCKGAKRLAKKSGAVCVRVCVCANFVICLLRVFRHVLWLAGAHWNGVFDLPCSVCCSIVKRARVNSEHLLGKSADDDDDDDLDGDVVHVRVYFFLIQVYIVHPECSIKRTNNNPLTHNAFRSPHHFLFTSFVRPQIVTNFCPHAPVVIRPQLVDVHSPAQRVEGAQV